MGGGVNAQVGIGTTTPNASAVLDLTSTTQGLLPPRMTQAQRSAISSPTTGLMVYQTDGTSGLYFHTGSAWVYIINASGSTLPVANGGTGSTTGSITGTSALTFAAGGTNQDVTITPTGTGNTVLNGDAVVGTASPNASAVLEAASTTKGFLPPRMTQDQRNAIVSPAAGLMVWCTNCGTAGELQVYNGTTWTNLASTFTCGTSTVTFTYNGASVTYGTVTGANSKCWLDRNLGATQVATGSTDHLAYGDLFQWGRGADGHQRINWTNATTGTAVNSTTPTLSTTDTPGNALFITINGGNNDWRSPQNVNLWQGVSGTNNPCPSGYRLPTETEWLAERNNGGTAFWGTGSAQNNATGAFASPLKLPLSGYLNLSNGALNYVGAYGFYWSSTVSGANSVSLIFDISSSSMNTSFRKDGCAVRCLKD